MAEHGGAGVCSVTVVSFVLLQIAPVLTWMAKTPLYHISTYLGLIALC